MCIGLCMEVHMYVRGVYRCICMEVYMYVRVFIGVYAWKFICMCECFLGVCTCFMYVLISEV